MFGYRWLLCGFNVWIKYYSGLEITVYMKHLFKSEQAGKI